MSETTGADPAPKKKTAAKRKPAVKAPGKPKAAPKLPKAVVKFGSRPHDPEAIFAALMAARRQGGGDLERLSLKWLADQGIVVRFAKSAAVAHVPGGG